MGRATRDNAEYQDNPDSVSLHTTPDDYNYDDAPEISGMPPAYGDLDTPTNEAPALRHIPPPTTRMDHNNHIMISKGVPQVIETQRVLDARCDTDPVYLEAAVRSFAAIPPIPLIYIMGIHKETVKRGDKKQTNDVTDFRIVLNMQKYLQSNFIEGNTTSMDLQTTENGEKTYRGSFKKNRAPCFKQDIEVGAAKPNLKEWCHLYCASPSMLRIFRLSRTVSGFDETYMKNRLEGLIRSTNYRGKVSITFPIEDRNVDIYTSNRINEWRLKKWICWIFYLTFLWIFTWPYLFFATKRWAVVKADWPFSAPNGSGTKTYTTISEEQWVDKWNVGIRRLVLDRYQGEATEEQLVGVIARPEDPPMPIQMPNIRVGSGINGALGALQQGFQVANALSRGNLPGASNAGWGYDS
ncbi:hypothetical protein GQ43DRAFT_443425 [Delitschia confertaspora ATCC 74209]|uniref:Uncharacterized protein n=1 Tax=Delitschia confertaspora ATCC 74209 TaxID=1513339 RepID=A0A9P4MST4_9PLEO|nr:hypothetical protein GQ43DRAFT_443425 [Delitschia confertaspora ATCC 74209]